MRPFKTIGTILYYLGIIAMVSGLFILITGISSTLSLVMGQVRSISSDGSSAASCQSPPCVPANYTEDQPIFGPAEVMLNEQIDNVLGGIGLRSMGDANTDILFYAKFRRFFAFMAIGLALVLIGTLLRMFDSVDKYIEERGKKQAMEERYRQRVQTGKPEKNWVKYIKYEK